MARPGAQILDRQEDLPLGAHVITPRRGYVHHGIHVGGGRVVHYAGLSRSLRGGPVQEVSLEEFAQGRGVAIRAGGAAHYAPAVVAARARSRLGEDRYRIATNNCEHFCTWCLRGVGRSEQVERWLRLPLALAAAGVRIGRAVQTAAVAASVLRGPVSGI